MNYFYKESRSKQKKIIWGGGGRWGGGSGGLEEVNFFNKESKTF